MKSVVTISENLSIHYKIAGQGEIPVLFVPGWTMSSEVFERQFEYFSGSESYRFISFDPRSHGQSSITNTGNNYEQHARDLDKLILKLKLDKLVLGGWSSGTLTALSYVEHFGSDNLSGLIMLDGPPKAAGKDNKTEWVSYRDDDADGFRNFCTEGKRQNSSKFYRDFATWMLEQENEDAIAWVSNISKMMPNEIAADLNESSIKLNYADTLIELHNQLPLLFVVRAEREDCVRSWSDSNTPNASLEAFGKHMMFWEQSNRFNFVLDTFIQTCR